MRYAQQVGPDWRWVVKLDASTANSNAAALDDIEFVELTTGYAYRPLENDRFNALLCYSFFYDPDSSGQVGTGGATIDFAQRGHVSSADGIYEINNMFTVGAKLGARLGDVRLPAAGWINPT